MRLIITDDGKSPARGVLEIMLQPGWKTYWRDPGDGGIPPSLNGNGMSVELQFPAPERFDENGQTFSGYHTGVSLPFVLAETLVPVDKLIAFIGVCREICVPFQAEFQVARDSGDADLVEKAFGKLPKSAGNTDGVIEATRTADQLILKTAATGGTLFLAPDKGVYLAIPKGDALGFTVKILKEKTPGVKVHYTLKNTDGAVSGSFEMPK